MANTKYKELSVNGLWKNNPALVQLLGLCPLLAVTGSVVNALGLGLATMMVLSCSNIAVSLIRNLVNDAIRLPAFVMIIAAFTSCIELLMKAYAYELYEILGIFIPLIITNCAILGRADAFASKNSVAASAVDGFMMGMGFALVLVVLGGIRELIGSGTLFDNMDLLFGASAASWVIGPPAGYPGFLVVILPPGAFIVTGMLIAGKNIIDRELKSRAEAKTDTTEASSRRVRVTGHIS
ncbi:MAG: electron transport complex subunit E [Pseudomonadales bacterium]